MRVDLVFETPAGGTRIVEVKSSREIREVHKIQAALYGKYLGDEVGVSNRRQDIVLEPGFVYQVNNEAEDVREFLASDPKKASVTYRPHKDVCYTCRNTACPFLGMQTAGRTTR
jgi:predicted RecB family nuclease